MSKTMKATRAPKKVMMVVLCMVAALFILVACGGGSSPLVGRWSVVEVGGMEMPEDMDVVFYFSSDGTGTIEEDVLGDTWEESITWSTDNGTLTITDDWDTDSGPYRISGRRLYLYDDGEVYMILERQ